MQETTGLTERRATTIVTVILFVEALWVFLYKYLPLDAGLWALQAELVHGHLTGHSSDGWRLIIYPASNIGGPLLDGLLVFLFSGEVATRLLLTFGAIFFRGLGIVTLFRTLRVHDDTIYYLVPVIVLSGIWFTGALPYLLGETVVIWVIVFFISQDRPHSYAYWFVSIGLFIVSFFSALVFLLAVFVVITVMIEQRRSVHLSQGWMSEPRSVMSLLIPGAAVVALGLFGGEPIFRLSSTNFIPAAGIGREFFLLTPAPNVLEATFRYGDILHGILTIIFVAVLLGCFARAYFLAIEEVTWQSKAVRSAGYILLILALLGPFFSRIGIETSSWIALSTVMILGGSYSGGPAVRRTPLDGLLFTGALISLISTVLLNGFSIAQGSAAAEDVLKSSRSLITQERQTALEDQHIPHIGIRFVADSLLLQSDASHSVGTLSYSETAPIYLFTEPDLLKQPWAFQPRGGIVKTGGQNGNASSPAIPIMLGSADRYIDSTIRILSVMPKNAVVSPTFGPFTLSLNEDAGINIDKGEASYRLAIGTLKAGHPLQMADK
jgi:hypothetical protein